MNPDKSKDTYSCQYSLDLVNFIETILLRQRLLIAHCFVKSPRISIVPKYKIKTK
jgi:hypothetical protein